jgi:hypothetical protein
LIPSKDPFRACQCRAANRAGTNGCNSFSSRVAKSGTSLVVQPGGPSRLPVWTDRRDRSGATPLPGLPISSPLACEPTNRLPRCIAVGLRQRMSAIDDVLTAQASLWFMPRASVHGNDRSRYHLIESKSVLPGDVHPSAKSKHLFFSRRATVFSSCCIRLDYEPAPQGQEMGRSYEIDQRNRS